MVTSRCVKKDGAEPKKKRDGSAKPYLVVQFHPAPPTFLLIQLKLEPLASMLTSWNPRSEPAAYRCHPALEDYFFKNGRTGT
jgi:hypothetical protein